jgi:hypothetical protein
MSEITIPLPYARIMQMSTWTGVISYYRSHIDLTQDINAITLLEVGTVLIPLLKREEVNVNR